MDNYLIRRYHDIVDGRSDEWLENTFDGEVIDSHTFAGMLKINLAEKHAGSGVSDTV